MFRWSCLCRSVRFCLFSPGFVSWTEFEHDETSSVSNVRYLIIDIDRFSDFNHVFDCHRPTAQKKLFSILSVQVCHVFVMFDEIGMDSESSSFSVVKMNVCDVTRFLKILQVLQL